MEGLKKKLNRRLTEPETKTGRRKGGSNPKRVEKGEKEGGKRRTLLGGAGLGTKKRVGKNPAQPQRQQKVNPISKPKGKGKVPHALGLRLKMKTNQTAGDLLKKAGRSTKTEKRLAGWGGEAPKIERPKHLPKTKGRGEAKKKEGVEKTPRNRRRKKKITQSDPDWETEKRQKE